MAVATIPQEHTKSINIFDLPFYLVVAYLLIEYGRPQDFIPALGSVPLGMIIQIACFSALVIRFPGKISKVSILVIIFLLIMAMGIPFAHNNFYAFRATKLFAYMLFGAILPLIVFVNSYAKMEVIFRIWVIMVLFQAALGILGQGENVGYFGDENDFASILNMALPCSYFLLNTDKSTKWKAIYLFSIGMFVVANTASLSRGGFLGLIAVGMYCLAKSQRKVAALVITAMVIACMAIWAPSTYWDEISSIKTAHQEGDTGEERIFYWTLAWRMFLDNPIMGVGAGNYPVDADAYVLPAEKEERSALWGGGHYWGRACHSVYFTIISELGAPGALVFLLVVWNVWISMTKIEKESTRSLKKYDSIKSNEMLSSYHSYSLAVKGAMIGFLSSGAFLSLLYYPLFWTLVAYSEIVRSNYDESSIKNRQS